MCVTTEREREKNLAQTFATTTNLLLSFFFREIRLKDRVRCHQYFA